MIMGYCTFTEQEMSKKMDADESDAGESLTKYLRYIENPSEKLQLEAVNTNGEAIKLIKNPSEQVQLAAVNNTVVALKYMTNPSDKVIERVAEILPKFTTKLRNDLNKIFARYGVVMEDPNYSMFNAMETFYQCTAKSISCYQDYLKYVH